MRCWTTAPAILLICCCPVIASAQHETDSSAQSKTTETADDTAVSGALKDGPGADEGPGDTVVEELSIATEIGGMIVDETQTKIGRDFYEYFFAKWQAPHGIHDYTITVREKPMPRLGTQVTVTVNDMDAFEGFVQPRLEIIEELAAYAVQRSRSLLQNYQEVLEQLQGDDMQGSGIY